MDAVGQAGLLQRPLNSKVFRFADALAENPAKAIERDHACLSSLNDLKMPRVAADTWADVRLSGRTGLNADIVAPSAYDPNRTLA
jgi:hypothetical protein